MSTETKQAMAESSPAKNRRFYSRREVRSLAYIDLGRDNGGIVLNLSEGGIAIHSATSINDRRLPHIRFQVPQSTGWVEARGEVAWTSESKMQAGIQLVGLTDESRRQIREWVANGRVTITSPSPTVAPPGPTVRASTAEPRPVNAPQKPPSFSAPVSPPPPQIKQEVGTLVGVAASRGLPSKGSGAPSVLTGVPAKARQQGAGPQSGPRLASSNSRSVGTELGLRLGPAVAQSRPRPRWINWAAFGIVLLGMAGLSFFAGLRSGKGDSRPLFEGLLQSGAHADSASVATQQDSGGSPVGSAVVGRVTVTSRMYVPVAIPVQSDAGKTDRLQVGAIERRVEPQYPQGALQKRTEGTVQLHVTIGPDGAVENVATLSGATLLAQAASDALRQWRFKPTMLDGKPVRTEADMAVIFWLRPAQNPQNTSR